MHLKFDKNSTYLAEYVKDYPTEILLTTITSFKLFTIGTVDTIVAQPFTVNLSNLQRNPFRF